MANLKDVVTINVTFKLTEEDEQGLEEEMRSLFNVIDYKRLFNTDKLIATDEKFKKMAKAKKTATDIYMNYINKHN